MTTIALVLGGIVGIAILAALGATLNGWALSIIWSWFMVPLGMPAINVPTAIGLALVVSYMTHQIPQDTDESKTATERFIGAIVMTVVKPMLALLIGVIVKQFL